MDTEVHWSEAYWHGYRGALVRGILAWIQRYTSQEAYWHGYRGTLVKRHTGMDTEVH